MQDPLLLSFLRDIARLSWPSWDTARAVLADYLGDRRDRRAALVRAADCDVWAALHI